MRGSPTLANLKKSGQYYNITKSLSSLSLIFSNNLLLSVVVTVTISNSEVKFSGGGEEFTLEQEVLSINMFMMFVILNS